MSFEDPSEQVADIAFGTNKIKQNMKIQNPCLKTNLISVHSYLIEDLFILNHFIFKLIYDYK